MCIWCAIKLCMLCLILKPNTVLYKVALHWRTVPRDLPLEGHSQRWWNWKRHPGARPEWCLSDPCNTHTSTSIIPQNMSKLKISFEFIRFSILILKNPKSGHCCESAIQLSLVVFRTQSSCLSEGTIAHLHKHEALWPTVIESRTEWIMPATS